MNEYDNLYVVELEDCEGLFLAQRNTTVYKYPWRTSKYGNYMDHQVRPIFKLEKVKL